MDEWKVPDDSIGPMNAITRYNKENDDSGGTRKQVIIDAADCEPK